VPDRGLIARIVGFATRRPFLVVGVVGVLTALAVLGARTLRLGESIYDLFPHRPGPIADLAAYTRALAGQGELVVLVSGADPARVEQGTRRVAAALARLPSLTAVRAGLEGSAAQGRLAKSLLLLAGPDAWPEVERRLTRDLPAQLARLRRLLLAPLSPERRLITLDPLLLSEPVLEGLEGGVSRASGLFASRDGRAALIFATPRGPASDGRLCERLHDELERLAAAERAEERGSGLTLRFTGAHLYAYYIASALRRDLTVSSLVALLGVALIQLLFFRSLRLIPLSAATAGVALAWTLALAALGVGHLSALSLAFAALFIGMSDDALIHITAHTRRHLGERPAERLRLAVREVAPALITATATVVAAFLCFGLSTFTGLSHTGLLAATGLGLNLILALVFFPALAVLLPPGPGPSGTTLIDRWLEGLSELAQRRRLIVIVVAVLLGGGGLWAARGLTFSTDLSRLAPVAMPPAETDRAIAEAFERDRNRLLVLARGRDLEQVLRVNDALAERLEALRARGEVSGSLSLSRLLPSRQTQERRRARLRALDPPQLVRRLDEGLAAVGLDPAAFAPFRESLLAPATVSEADLPPALRPLVSRHLSREPDGSLLVATVVYPRPGASAPRLAAELERLAAPGVRVGVTGAVMAGAQMAQLLRRDLLLISLTTAGAVLLLLGLLVRRLWPVLATLLSLALAGVAFAGALRLLGLEMDVYNLMVIPIIIGYGVDDHLYLVHRSLKDGVRDGVVESGRPVLAATLTTMAAFAALALCRLPGLRTLGLTGTLGLGLGLTASLVVMPALLTLGSRRR